MALTVGRQSVVGNLWRLKKAVYVRLEWKDSYYCVHIERPVDMREDLRARHFLPNLCLHHRRVDEKQDQASFASEK
jgi:hypothetical protein